MTVPTPDERSGAPRAAGCTECAAPLAHDQRYCVECGERRGPLPSAILALLDPPGPGGSEETDGLAAPAGIAAKWLDDLSMPAPRVAAVAVMGILAFGVILGSVVSPAANSAASAPIVVVAAAPASPPASPAAPVSTDTPEAPAETTPAEAPAETTPAAAPASTAPAEVAPVSDGPQLPPVKHVFLIVLSDHGYDAAFGPTSQAPYLATTLSKQGELLTNYYAVAPSGLANGIALISGQGPNPEAAANCPTYSDLAAGTVGEKDQVAGSGCVYPTKTLTLADQLVANGYSWRAYAEDMGNGPEGEPKTCRHPALGSLDADQAPRPGDAFVTWRDPFVYFHTVTDGEACAQNDVGLDRLVPDLKVARTAPSLAYILPNRCHDGAEEPCAPGQPSGLPAADAFLRTVVPEIMGSDAYKDGGLIAITFDEAPQTGPGADPSACCDTPLYPNLPTTPAPATPTTTTPTTTTPTTPTTTTPVTTTPTTTTPTTTTPAPTTITGGSVSPTGGGGRVGLLLISSFVKPGTVNLTEAYNHFSLLNAIQSLFGLEHLGYAADPTLPTFDKIVYNDFPKK